MIAIIVTLQSKTRYMRFKALLKILKLAQLNQIYQA